MKGYKMKYHKHIIKKVHADLGEFEDKWNYMYEVYTLDGKYVGEEPCLNGAKELVDYGESTY